MTDLLTVLPSFSPQPYSHLIPSLEKNCITTTDLITLDNIEIARRARLPLADVTKLCADVLNALQADNRNSIESWSPDKPTKAPLSSLDSVIDHALGGGIPTGHVSEIVGESGAGKTQFLLLLCLSAQLPQSQGGLSKSSIYLSTESGLSTPRLAQMVQSLRPHYDQPPSLDRVLTLCCTDLESQNHILRYQVPAAIERHNVGLIVIDSIAANFRSGEFSHSTPGGRGAAMGKRAEELSSLGALLRDLARKFDVAVVVANQVMDRISRIGSASNGALFNRADPNFYHPFIISDASFLADGNGKR